MKAVNHCMEVFGRKDVVAMTGEWLELVCEVAEV